MATSGSYNLSSSYGTIRVEWWKISHNVNNNTTRIGWRAVATWSGSTWLQVYACRIWINGAQVLNRGSAQTWGGQFASGEIDIGMNSDGNKYFGSNGEAAIYTAALNAWGSGGWDLPQVPRGQTVTAAIGNFNDEQNPWLNYTNPAGANVEVYLLIRNPADTATLWHSGFINKGTASSGSHTFNLTTAQREEIRAAMVNLQTTKARMSSRATIGGQEFFSYIVRDITIVNGNPVFTDFSYKDSNATTVAITGNDQYLIQEQSTLQVTITAAQKMQTAKEATPVRYRYQIGSIDTTQNYTTSDLVKELGVVGLNSNAPLVVTAVDSRNLAAAAQKSINILPYQPPQLNPVAERVNNFETSTKIKATGVISRLTVGGVDKNAVNTTNGLQYRYKKTDTGTWGAWQNIASTTSSGNVSMTDFFVNLDRNFAWNVEFRLVDKLATTSVALIVGVGIPIFRIGTNGKLYNNEHEVVNTDSLALSSGFYLPDYEATALTVSTPPTGAITDAVVYTAAVDSIFIYNAYGLPTGTDWYARMGKSAAVSANNIHFSGNPNGGMGRIGFSVFVPQGARVSLTRASVGGGGQSMVAFPLKKSL